MWIMIAGPYRSTSSESATRAANLHRLNEHAYVLFQKGHVPIIGVNLALPIIRAAGEDHYDEIMMPLSLAVAERCDAIFRIPGESRGADQEVDRFRARGLPVFTSIDQVPNTRG